MISVDFVQKGKGRMNGGKPEYQSAFLIPFPTLRLHFPIVSLIQMVYTLVENILVGKNRLK